MNTRKTKSESIWSMLLGLIALTVLGLVFAQALNTAINTSGAVATQTQASESTVTPSLVDIEATYAAYQSGGENPPPTAPKDPTLAPAPPTIEPLPFPTGIFEGGGDAFYSGDVTILNYWQNMVNGEPVQVFAGSLYNDSGQGLVIVLSSSPAGRFYTPTKAGAVQITGESGLRLTLISTGGITFYFDIPSRQFVDSLEVTVMPVPTEPYISTPAPTPPSPYPGPTSPYP